MAINISNYQGGGDIQLSGMVGGVLQAFNQSQERERQEAKERELREEKNQNEFLNQLATTMAKVPTKGLQAKDIPGFQKLMTDMEESYIQAARSTDKAQQLQHFARMKQLATEATVYTQQSEATGKKKADLLKMLQNGYEKYRAEDALKAINDHYDRPLSEITSDIDLMDYRHKWDSKQLDKTLDDVKKGILESSTDIVPQESIIGSSRSGYDTINTFRSVREIPKETAMNAFSNQYNMNPNFKRYVDTEFDGPLNSKLSQLYDNLSVAGWNTEVKDSQRVAGRAPRSGRSSGGGGSSSSSDTGDASPVYTDVSMLYAGTESARASRQTALKGNGMKARLGKNVRAYDMATGDPIELTSNMQDGVITEFVTLPTGDVRGGGRRVLSEGTEGRFPTTRRDEDFAVVRYKSPIYVDEGGDVFMGTPAEAQRGVRDGVLKQRGSEEAVGLFPLEAVLPDEASMTKGERATLDNFRSTPTARGAQPAAQQPSDVARRVLDAL